MKKSLKYRAALADIRRIVVKLGSRVLVQKTGRPDIRQIKGLVRDIAHLQRAGYEIVVVTSGAIGAGMEALGMKERPTALPDLQMAAAVGQSRLMSRYDALFSAAGCKIGQVLLTHEDFHHKIRFTNARRTMENMIRNKVIPIVNENDVVADEEIKADLALGDNDLLASLLVKLIRADLLIMLTTVDGLRKSGKNGITRRVRYLESITRNTYAMVTGSKSKLSIGGMSSKLRAAESVSRAGCSALIANGRKSDVLTEIMSGKDVGTLILASAM
ncbi:MAG: glutamate 5-kinase [Kiritimatiellae bacterium]|nr:glutamate 5-kinase [Kiritimatiellia bacterium]MDD5519593.1 glutamate 5-kinase [Kiritimatiellia bacterium]